MFSEMFGNFSCMMPVSIPEQKTWFGRFKYPVLCTDFCWCHKSVPQHSALLPLIMFVSLTDFMLVCRCSAGRTSSWVIPTLSCTTTCWKWPTAPGWISVRRTPPTRLLCLRRTKCEFITEQHQLLKIHNIIIITCWLHLLNFPSYHSLDTAERCRFSVHAGSQWSRSW